MNTLVIYHGGGCFDGFCAAWLFSKAFPDAEFVPAHYGSEPPDVVGRDVYVADFSYKRGVMLVLAGRAKSLTVLDHHKTAQADLDGLAYECEMTHSRPGPHVVFDMDKSGGRLAWEYLYGSRLLPDSWLATSHSGYSLGVAPWLVDYTEDRDLWRWAMPRSQEVNAALRSYPMEFDVWDQFAKRIDPQSFAAEGAAILRRDRQIVEQHVKHARPVAVGGVTVPAVNATVLFSEIAGELAKGQPFGACYFDRGDGMRQWSLRSEPGGADVSEVARKLGGGGHRNAAGFSERIAGTGG